MGARPLRGSPRGPGATPEATTRTRSGGTANASTISAFIASAIVCTHAPLLTARRIKAGKRNDVVAQSSGNRSAVRSYTDTTLAALRAGGTTKFVPCTTVTPPVKRSTTG